MALRVTYVGRDPILIRWLDAHPAFRHIPHRTTGPRDSLAAAEVRVAVADARHCDSAEALGRFVDSVRACYSRAKLVVIAEPGATALAAGALESGATAVVTRPDDTARIASAIDAVAAGGLWLGATGRRAIVRLTRDAIKRLVRDGEDEPA
jgi:DNA-binding NarL/FixJ family response regulator